MFLRGSGHDAYVRGTNAVRALNLAGVAFQRHSFVANAIKISLPLAKLSLRRQIKSLNEPTPFLLKSDVPLD